MKVNERSLYRKRAGLTQIRLGRLAGGISGSRICLWERGEIELTASEVERIARIITAELRKLSSVPTETEVAGALAADGGSQ